MATLRLFMIAALVNLALGARHLLSLDAVKSNEGEFDYFLFVRQWPGNFCSAHSCPTLHNHGFQFTIHGLWPNYNDGTWPQFCDSGYPFDEKEVDDLEKVMEDEWPSFGNPDEWFWEHEWGKHGTCSLKVFPDEHKYFKAILQLHQKYNLEAALTAANILPSPTKVYRNSDLADAIQHMYGVRPLVHCNGKRLSEIWLCFDKSLQPFDCDTDQEQNTCQTLTIPPVKANNEVVTPLGGLLEAREESS